jgi:thioredoxin:protein disulfide reductase
MNRFIIKYFLSFLISAIIPAFCLADNTTPFHLTPLTTESCQSLPESVDNRYQLEFELPADAHNGIYHDSLNFSIDHPAVHISSWSTLDEPEHQYDPVSKDTKKIFNKPVHMQLLITAGQTDIKDVHLYCTYRQQRQKNIQHHTIPLNFQSPAPISDTKTCIEDAASTVASEKPASPSTFKQQAAPSRSWSHMVEELIKTTESTPLRLLLVLLLGVLLSLTPCIYPMIPITVGLLQAQGSPSLVRNLVLSLSYTIGLASTFALLGLTAAFTGQLFGSIMSKAPVVLSIVGILSYMAGSMIGLYNMYIPSWMQPGNQSVKGGSPISAFIFGAASGTVASPCLSPGLILLLSLVTTLGSKLMGFALLFSFGIGLSIPLLIIGTFSSSLNVLPQAGMWMIEIKQLFGFVLIIMCFYFLKNIAPWYLIMGLGTIAAAAIGLFYLRTAAQTTSSSWRSFKNGLGMVLLASSVLLLFQTYKAYSIHYNPLQIGSASWYHDYDHALAHAQQTGKYLFVDLTAPYCSICTAIDKKLFTNQTVLNELDQLVPVKIDISDTSNSVHATVQKQFTIVGVPAFLIVDPATQQVVQRWGGELYDMTAEEFIENIQKIVSSKH